MPIVRCKLCTYPGMTGTTLDTPNDPHRLLGQFLRARREAVAADALLGEGRGRRRTPGLRREEVAQRAGISTTWYTWLEQGRDVALSADALARLAEGLGLSAAERTYLFELARRRDPSPHMMEDTGTADELLRAVAAQPMPAYLLDRHWRRRTWNAPAAELFAAWRESGEDNLLRFVFLDPAARELIIDWEDRAQRVVAEFRADTALYPDDAMRAEQVDMLRRESPSFERYWNAQGVLAREGGRRTFNHPQLGQVAYTQVTLMPAGHIDFKLVLLLPEGGAPNS
ncbi:helix-turn-helix domain-containing protein [Dyella terrae]|nr:helix-turn-helix domain-containing protein [Dyella terrae]